MLVLSCSATLGLQGQSSSSQPDQQPAAPAQAQPTPSQPPLTVQARIRARREQRRAAAIHDSYSHLYETYVGAGYLRFHPGDGAVAGQKLQKVNEYAWDLGFTRYYSERLGVTIDGRGTYGTAYVGNPLATNGAINKPAISQYAGMIGPTYRFVLNPKYSVSGRILAGGAYGIFSGDTGSFGPTAVGLYPDGASVMVSASVPVEYNVSPNLALRVAPEYVLTNFGSEIQNNLGFTAGVVVRFGKR